MDGINVCPFCKTNKALIAIIDEWSDDVGVYQVVCDYCGARGPAELSKKKAVESWNEPTDGTGQQRWTN